MTPIPEKALQASRQVLFEDEEMPEDNCYFGGGSCTLVEWADRVYVLTAEHVLRNRRPESARIPLYQGSRSFLPIDHSVEIVGEDEDWKDIRLFRVDPSKLDEPIMTYPLLLTEQTFVRGARALKRNGRLAISGFPDPEQRIDYETLKIRSRRVILSADFVECDPERRYMGTLRITDTAGVRDFNGFSGSPVFAESVCGFGFAGIALQGSANSRLVHFVSPDPVVTLLRKANELTA